MESHGGPVVYTVVVVCMGLGLCALTWGLAPLSTQKTIGSVSDIQDTSTLRGCLPEMLSQCWPPTPTTHAFNGNHALLLAGSLR
jgi:hypothetical protein